MEKIYNTFSGHMTEMEGKDPEIIKTLDNIRAKAIEAFPGFSYITCCSYERLAFALTNWCSTWISHELDGREKLALIIASCW